MELDACDELLTMSAIERRRASVLIVEPDGQERQDLRNAVRSLGFGETTDAHSHAVALEKLNDRRITHIVFAAKKTDMPPKEFLAKVFQPNVGTICIPVSAEPEVDDVFELLVMGAKGCLCKPFTIDTVEQAIVSATKGEPIAEAVLRAKDRNEALVAIIMSSLDRAATILRQAARFDTARREMPRAMGTFRRSADLAKTFAKDGRESLMIAMENLCIERGKGPASRLGRLRKRLRTARVVGETDDS